MASTPQYRPPTLGDLLNNFGVDPQLVNGGVIGMCDIAEDFLSRLSRHHTQPEQQQQQGQQTTTEGTSTGQGCPAAGGQSTSATDGQQSQVPSPYDFWRQIQQTMADYHGTANATTTEGQTRECRRKCPYTKQFELKVDVNGYKQEDLKIKVENGFITVTGRHESGDEESSESRHFERRQKLPADIILEKMTSKMVKGQLIVAAPLKSALQPKKHQVIPIQVVGQEKPSDDGKKGPSSPGTSTDEEPMDAFEKLE